MTPNALLYCKGIRNADTRKAFAEYQNERRSKLKKEPKHGIRQYHAGCRCLVCLEAHHHKKYATQSSIMPILSQAAGRWPSTPDDDPLPR